MELDRTKVAVRERNILELWDMALGVIRDFSPGLVAMMLLGILPFAIANGLLLGWIGSSPEAGGVWRYYWLLAIMVFIEAPLATSLGTMYLGDAMFLQPPTLRTMLKTLWKFKGRLLLCQGCLRGVIPAIGLAVTVGIDDVGLGDIVLPLLALYLILIRALRPYLAEIILLEQNPLSSSDERVVTINRRSNRLHGPNSGDLFLRYLAAIPMSVTLAISLCLGVWFVFGIALSNWEWNWWMRHVVAPGSMWATAAYFAVVRYLAYLDLRIRREGWAVELQLRAEANRLTQRPAM